MAGVFVVEHEQQREGISPQATAGGYRRSRTGQALGHYERGSAFGARKTPQMGKAPTVPHYLTAADEHELNISGSLSVALQEQRRRPDFRIVITRPVRAKTQTDTQFTSIPWKRLSIGQDRNPFVVEHLVQGRNDSSSLAPSQKAALERELYIA